MEQLREIPIEVARRTPAYEHLTRWLTGQGIHPEDALKFTFRVYRFQQTATEILRTPVLVGIMGKKKEDELSPTLHFRLVWPEFVAPSDEIRPELEGALNGAFASEIGEVAVDKVHVELNFVSDFPELESHHIGFIGITEEEEENLGRVLRAGRLSLWFAEYSARQSEIEKILNSSN